MNVAVRERGQLGAVDGTGRGADERVAQLARCQRKLANRNEWEQQIDMLISTTTVKTQQQITTLYTNRHPTRVSLVALATHNIDLLDKLGRHNDCCVGREPREYKINAQKQIRFTTMKYQAPS